jgi:NAD(P)-dependent dehydrogenase (short-subunit alcohol dehydrogenase family)
MSLQNKIALVTGGSRGPGREMALRLAEKGSDVIITYHSQKEMADEVVNEITGRGRKAVALQFDSSNFKFLESFINKVLKNLQNIWNISKFDFLINNAGIGATIPFEKVTEEDFDRFLNIHFKSIYFLCQQSLPMLNDNGRIINISTGHYKILQPWLFCLLLHEGRYRSIHKIPGQGIRCQRHYGECDCTGSC